MCERRIDAALVFNSISGIVVIESSVALALDTVPLGAELWLMQFVPAYSAIIGTARSRCIDATPRKPATPWMAGDRMIEK